MNEPESFKTWINDPYVNLRKKLIARGFLKKYDISKSDLKGSERRRRNQKILIR